MYGVVDMKVVILNTSDSNGGAAVVSFRLMRALCDAGADARMLVVDRRSGDERVAVAGTPEQYKWAFYTERLKIFMRNGFSRDNLFKVSTACCGVDVLSHEWVKRADVVCINWINQGMMSLRDVERLCKMGKKVVWTMHDMWCCTGICHHAYDCGGYRQECGRCPFLGSRSKRDLSHKVWKRKKRIFDESAIHFVPVSNWLAQQCRESSLLRDKPLTVIPNAVPVERFDWHRKGDLSKKVIAMGAARLDDPVKGFGLMVEAVNKMADKHPDNAAGVELLLFGNIRDESLLSGIRLPYRWIGAVPPERVPELYRQCDVVVSSSHFETLPTTLVEGQAAGCLAVAFDHGGQPDIISHLHNGYLAVYPDASDLAAGLLWAVSQSQDREMLHREVAGRFSGEAVAHRYLSLLESL